MLSLFTGDWWKAAAMRAGRTAAVVALPYVPVSLNSENYLLLLSVAATGAILSVLTSLAGLAEVEGAEQPWYFSLLSRVVKTVAQALVTAVGAAVVLTDINWDAIPALVVSSAIGTALLFFTKGAPEAPKPALVEAAPVTIINEVETVPAAEAEKPEYPIAPDTDGR